MKIIFYIQILIFYISLTTCEPQTYHPNSFYNRLPSNNYLINSEDMNSRRSSYENPSTGPEGRTGHHKRKKHRNQNRPFSDPCTNRYRRALPPSNGQGRFLWDLNVYNIYSNTPKPQVYQSGGTYPLFPSLFPFNFGIPNYFANNLNDCRGFGNNGLSSSTGSHNGHPIFNLLNFGSSNPLNSQENSNIIDPVYNEKPVSETNGEDSQDSGPFIQPGELVNGVSDTVNDVIHTISNAATRYGQNTNRVIRRLYRNIF